MTVSMLPNGRTQFLDLNAVPLVGGLVWHWIPGTLDPKTTYEDPDGTVPNMNPITLDEIGSAAIWGSGSYRQQLFDASGNLIWDTVTTAPAPGDGTLLSANNLDDVDDAATSRTNLGLGTAATHDTGTTGTKVPLLDGTNTWSGVQTLEATAVLSEGATVTQPAAPATNAVGYLGTPQNPIVANYQLAMTDAGGEVFVGATCTITIPPAATVAFPRGTIIDIAVDQTFTLTLAAGGGVTLRWPVGNVTTPRTVTGPGAITIKLEKTNEWWVRGGVNIS